MKSNAISNTTQSIDNSHQKNVVPWILTWTRQLSTVRSPIVVRWLGLHPPARPGADSWRKSTVKKQPLSSILQFKFWRGLIRLSFKRRHWGYVLEQKVVKRALVYARHHMASVVHLLHCSQSAFSCHGALACSKLKLNNLILSNSSLL